MMTEVGVRSTRALKGTHYDRCMPCFRKTFRASELEAGEGTMQLIQITEDIAGGRCAECGMVIRIAGSAS